jgi:putative endonuclease
MSEGAGTVTGVGEFASGQNGSGEGRLGVGRAGEDAAAAEYLRCGYRVVARNWRCRLGEIDLIVTRGSVLVFCEVKSRRGSALGRPFEAVTWKKQRKLRALAQAFLAGTDLGGGDVRFDVASVTIDRAGLPSVHVFDHAF